MKVSIIVPCYNEEEIIPQLTKILRKIIIALQKTYSIELIFVDDGSKDNTFQLLTKSFGKYKFVKIISYDNNKGVGNALKTGIRNFTGDILVQLDADVTYTPQDVINMINYLKNYDISSASPYHPKGKVIGVQKYRIFLSKLASWIYKLLSGSNIHTYTSSFRAYKRNVIKNIKFRSSGFVCFAEILLLALLKKYKVKEYPVVLRKRNFGESKMKTLNVIFEHLNLMSRILRIKIKSKI